MSARHNSWMVFLILMLAAMPAAAQDQQGQQNAGQSQNQPSQQDQNPSQGATPIPAYHSPFASQADNGSNEPVEPLTPDTSALSGAEILRVAGPETEHSYWQPHVDISGTGDSNAQELTSGSSWGTWVSISGGVDLHRTGGDSDLALRYQGGGTFSDDSGVSNGIVQQLGLTDRISLRRWTLTFVDQVYYLPESGYGYGGLGGTALPSGSTGLGTAFTDSQTILFGEGQNVTNAFTTEADYAITARTSLTLVGGYSLLRYVNAGPGLVDSGNASFRAGYNYLWSRKDTVAVLYTFNAFRYTNSSQSINQHTVQASYGRRVTGRLAFQIAAGPQVVLFSSNPSGGSGTAGSMTSNTQLYWALDTSAQYRWERAMLSATYSHGVTSGSGVLAGSVTDTASGSITRQMSRTFSSGITAGYSRNKGLIEGAVSPASQVFDYWFAGANFSRPWGRSLGLTFSYQMQYQNSNTTFCIAGMTCGTSVIRHLISVGLGWHQRPILF